MAADEPSTLAVLSGTADLDGRTFPISVTMTEGGALFSLAPLVQGLGAEVEAGAYGEGYTLRLLENEVLFGPGSPAVTMGEQIVVLSQPPIFSAAGLQVPLDFLENTFGVYLGHRFSWDRVSQVLSIQGQSSRSLAVSPQLVHLQGTTTLAFGFSEAPRYQLEERPGVIEILIRGDRLQAEGRLPGGDPLVRSVAISEQRITIRLAEDAAAQSYVLDSPFRLVFDVYREVGSSPVNQPSLVRPRRRGGIRTIVIDPGHGGSESGALGASGSAEKDLTLILARTLKRHLERRMAVRVVLTRETDENLALQSRPAIANQNKADLFISLHLNSSFGSSAHGAETFILNPEASDAGAADIAAIENQAGGDGGESTGGQADPLYDLQLILWDMSQSHHLSESLRFATLIQGELNEALSLRDRGVKQAPFKVLMGASMPAVLVELGFISNPREEAKLQDPAYRAQLVEALVRAVSRYKATVEHRPESPATDEEVP
ncbi:MAG: N-acetylmuramoyl-L-alanine amidase [Deltaproteobacteria bacterium]|nr:N-acetylmuramoyl-L-alanine amidase [Deltaproteobacteria bacterium]